MSYNTNNVWIEGYYGFLRMQQTGFLHSHIRPTYNVLAEGDSWFHIGGLTGIGNARNIIDELTFNNQHTMVCNMALSGDTMSNMAYKLSSKYFYDLLKRYKWDGLVISGGGNDLFDALTEAGGYKYKRKTLSLLQANPDGNQVVDFINAEHLDLFCEALLGHYSKFIENKNKTDNAAVPVFLHTYDYPTPRNAPAKLPFFEAGPWIYPRFKKLKIPKDYWQGITDYVFNRLAVTLLSLDGNDNFHVIETFGLLDRASADSRGSNNDWLNEIHPNSKGIKKIADAMNTKIADFY